MKRNKGVFLSYFISLLFFIFFYIPFPPNLDDFLGISVVNHRLATEVGTVVVVVVVVVAAVVVVVVVVVGLGTATL